MYVCIYEYKFCSFNAYISIYVCMNVSMYLRMRVSMYVYVYVYLYAYMCSVNVLWVHVCVYVLY